MTPVVIGNATLYLGDCREILPMLGPLDLVLTDPPFGMGNFVQVTGTLKGRGKGIGKPVSWNESGPSTEFFTMLRGVSRHRIIWGANFFNCFEPEGGAVVWVKNQPMPNFSKAEVASCTHFKKTEVVNITWHNFEVGAKAQTHHPCERPVDLYEWCINYIPKIESVCDPFMGSGSTAVAAYRQNKPYIGIEINPEYFDMACTRIEAVRAQGRLFA